MRTRGLGATSGADRKLKNIFLLRRIFSGKADSVILLGFEYITNSENLIKIVTATFEEIDILNFFIM